MIAVGIILIAILIMIASRLLTSGFDNPNPLTRERIIQALTRLGELAMENGYTLTLVVVGGAALVLRYNVRASTRDVDVFMAIPPERRNTRAWATTVAQALGLPADWLNDGATGFMQKVSYGPLLLETHGICVYQVSSEQLLAMKLSAWRDDQDIDDATVVLRDLVQTYGDKEALWNAVKPYVNDMKAQYAFEEVWENVHG